MSVAAARNWRRQDRASISQEVGRLFLQIDLDRSARLLAENRPERQEQNRYSRADFPEHLHNLLQPAHWLKVSDGDRCFNCRVRVVTD